MYTNINAKIIILKADNINGIISTQKPIAEQLA